MTNMKRAWFCLCLMHSRTTGRFIFHYNIYGIRVLGVQFTPKTTARILMDGRGFDATQNARYTIYLLFNACYVFFPKHELDPVCIHPFSSICREHAR